MDGSDDRIAETMTTRIVLKINLCWLPRRGPIGLVLLIAKIDVATVPIRGCIVVSVARKASQSSIAIKRIATCSIGDDPNKVVCAKVVDPRLWCIRAKNNVLSPRIIESTESQEGSPSAAPREIPGTKVLSQLIHLRHMCNANSKENCIVESWHRDLHPMGLFITAI